jgi:3-methyl-2-oxobutanoate hydroxymethyltransferase
MVPSDLAIQITKELNIPTIGIGAGNGTDAQVLVWTDAFGLTKTPPKLARSYRNLRSELLSGAKEFAQDVASGAFPSEIESFK